MTKAPDVPRLVNFTDSDLSSGSESEDEGKNYPLSNVITSKNDKGSACLGSDDTKQSDKDNLKYDSRLDDPNYSKWLSDKPSVSKFDDKPVDYKCRERRSSSGSRRSRSKGRSSGSRSRRSRSRGRRSGSKSRRSSSRGKRSYSRGRSGSRGRRTGSKGKRSRSRSRDKYRRSRSGSRGRYSRSRSNSRGRHRRSRSGSRRRKERRHSSPRRPRRISPPRAHKTLDTLEKLGIEFKPTPPEEQQPVIPPYYNRMSINPAKYAQQIAKRKLIWGSKTSEEGTAKASTWQGATFSQDQDGKMTAKFKRLMGIKQEGPESSTQEKGQELIKRQQEIFSSMEIQYEAARQATHTQRGVGLGFSSHPHHFP